MADIRPTPVSNRAAYYLAGLLDSANEAVSKPFGYENDVVRGITNLLGVPSAVKTLENVAYGMPNTTGTGMATQLRPEAKETVANLLPMAPGAGKAAIKGAVSAGKYAAPKVGQMAEQYAVKTGLLNPMIAYHGSPYSFDAFDLAHVGKGEGAQAYGHGMYFAESPSVAADYQKKLSSVGGAKNLVSQFSDVDGALNEAARRVEHYQQLIANGGGGDSARAQRMLGIAEKNLQDLQRMKAGLPENTGSLYKVDIPDPAVATFLDWDKPLSQQPLLNQSFSKLPEYARPLDQVEASNVIGQRLYQRLVNKLGEKGASDELAKVGIQGIRYLDGGSRSAGAGTSNFVVFDPSIVKILERNGQPMGLLEEATK